MKYSIAQNRLWAHKSLLITTLVAVLSSCATPQSEYKSPPISAERAIVYAEGREFMSSDEHVRILEIDRVDSEFSFSEGLWQQFDVPDSVDLASAMAWAVSPGEHKLLIGACRANYIPLCDYKCAKVVLRIDAAAGGLYRIRTDIDDDRTKFRIVDARNGEIVVGPTKVESHCSISPLP